MNPETLVRTVEDFLIGSRDAVVMEDGAVAFDLAQSKYSISGERNKCVLHLWSSERNVVRRVIEAEVKNEVLRLEVQRLGQARPSKLEICRERDRRTPTAKRAARLTYSRTLQRMLEKKFRGYTVAKLTTAMDLERSFGPIYTRGLLRQGQSAFAVLGVNREETQASIRCGADLRHFVAGFLSSGSGGQGGCRRTQSFCASRNLSVGSRTRRASQSRGGEVAFVRI